MRPRPLDRETMDEPPSPRVRPVFGTGHGPAGYARPAWVAAAAVSMVAAGLIHLAIAPLHWGHAPAHGLFFAVSGLAEAALRTASPVLGRQLCYPR